MADRDFRGAAALLLDGVATFTCTELCSYETFIFYTVSGPRTMWGSGDNRGSLKHALHIA